MSKVTIVLLIIAAIMLVGLVVLYFLGKKAEKKKAQQDEQIAAAAQSVSMLIIDKKKMRITEAGFPAAVVDQMPKLMRRSKLPIVKAKVGPKVMSFICEASIFDSIPVKKEVKATVSGLYITAVKGLHGSIAPTAPKKQSFRDKLRKKYNETSAALEKEKAEKEKTKKKK